MQRAISICLIIMLTPFLIAASGEHSLDNKLEKLRYIKEMPYYPPLSGDKEYWEVVKEGRKAIVPLINRIDDTTETEAPVANFGGNYAVGDIAISLLGHIIRGIPILDCIPGESNQGFWEYWEYVREDPSHRKTLKKKLLNWYHSNEQNLTWVEDLREHRTGRNWGYDSKTHPAGGYYVAEPSKCDSKVQ